MITLWVDFNEVEDDSVWTSLRQTRGASTVDVHNGGWVALQDDDGARCWGIVSQVDGPIVTIKLDWSTWREDGIELQTTAGWSPVVWPQTLEDVHR